VRSTAANPDIRAQAAPPARETLFEPETEKRWTEAAKGIGDGAGMFTRFNLAAARIGQAFTRHWINLPNVPKYAALQQELRKLEAAPQAAKERAVRHLKQVLVGLTRADMDLFARKVVTDDLAWEADNEHELPFGFTPETLSDARRAIDEELSDKPRVVDAVRRRKALNRTIAQELVAAGVLDAERLKNPAYYRHVVLDLRQAEAAAARVKGVGKKLRSPRWARAWAAARTSTPITSRRSSTGWRRRWSTFRRPRRSRGSATASTTSCPGCASRRRPTTRRRWTRCSKPSARSMATAAGRSTRRSRASASASRWASSSSRTRSTPRTLIFRRACRTASTRSAPARGDPFPFLSWLLDTNGPGANGAATILKAISQRRVFTAQGARPQLHRPDRRRRAGQAPGARGLCDLVAGRCRLLFTVKTMPEHAIDAMLEKIDAAPGVSGDDIRAMIENVRSALAFGGMRYAMILPDEVASTLNQLRREDFSGLIDAVAEKPLKLWKQWVLINPRRVLKYNLNNLSGDLGRGHRRPGHRSTARSGSRSATPRSSSPR
jgi:hypothetical protein